MAHAIDPHHPTPVLLATVARELGVPWSGSESISGLAISTADVRPGALFAALPGRTGHGARYSSAARAVGAAAILTDPDGATDARRSGLPVLVVDAPRQRLGRIAQLIAGTEHLPFPLFGVTGTNGKTSTVHLLDALQRRLGRVTALSSTVERRVAGESAPSVLTTPEAPELHAFLARAVERSVQGAALEVSAQGLSRNRMDGVVVDVAGFTNLSHDHLDDYVDMDAYLAAKALLFTAERSRAGVASLDSAAGRRIVRGATVPITTVSAVPGVAADWIVRVLEQGPEGTRSTVTTPGGTVLTVDSPLLGEHMAANAGLALAMLAVSGVPLPDLVAATQEPLDVVVPGRMSDASLGSGPRVFVDFAHTPDAFEKSLEAVRAFATGRVAIVVGADGDRDPSKRPVMGAVAAAGADVVVITDHHPRFEDPAPIRASILGGTRTAAASALVLEEPDPARAIRRAVAEVGPDGVVYWAGPGLTDYRDVAGVHVPYSSFRDARAALREAGYGTVLPVAREESGASNG
ncbi:Mur ligase family protein [Curtobacterium sp. ISL-83]|uniref:Mur ligase family protein n=1 Tax=Curtobacterium sp. ISL-83 TaxID=2819145 RepID=UPI001BE5DC3C|nr:UDP-N-acetylmuramoyl-L-alanyl-D-glutamate--2,6-diaminopimelate ligase [Curtobacterium sp. ISL-83]MBT2501735.1 UDP-N-acetylmuramoyl-L-alanyl-D-glutamate--2,6-diaminopimelate ligase [Curtobacterium sp. ISL-83]